MFRQDLQDKQRGTAETQRSQRGRGLEAKAGSILQIEPDVLNWAIGMKLLSAMKNTKCLGSVEDD